MSGFSFVVLSRDVLLRTAHPFVAMNLIAVALLLLMRVYELFSVSRALSDDTGAFGFAAQILFVEGSVLGAVMFVLSLLFALTCRIFSEKTALRLHQTFLGMILAGSFLLAEYFSVTLVPLGADLFGYTVTDIAETIGASGGVSFGAAAGAIVLLLLIFFLRTFADRFTASRKVVAGFYVWTALSFPLSFVLYPAPQQFPSETEYSVAENKFVHFVSGTTRYLFSRWTGGSGHSSEEYPLLRAASDADVLGGFFTSGSVRPNIVIVIVEGLGSSFVEGGTYAGFTPFFDSLSRQSLFWKNFLSTTGRTFGVLPAVTASLPLHPKGFMDLGAAMPDHRSLFTILKENGYRTSFFYGGKIGFDGQGTFLERQGVDAVIDEEDFPPSYERSAPTADGFSWGYPDKELFRRAFAEIDSADAALRLDVYLTLSTHEPFDPPGSDQLRKRVESILVNGEMPEGKRERFRRYSEVFASLLYADDALREFLSAYERREEYHRTIFIITGDHRLIPVPFDTKIDRYRVPLLIFSPMLNTARTFHSVSTHMEVAPTLLSLLKNRYRLAMPEEEHWVGSLVDTTEAFRNIHTRLMMPFKGEMSDMIDGKHFLSGSRLFTLLEGLDIEEITDDSIAAVVAEKRDALARMFTSVVDRNKIFPLPRKRRNTGEEVDDRILFAAIDRLRLNSDQLFLLARDTAFNGYYAEARGLCRRLLAINPDFHDVRTLLGRTLAWEHRYEEAKTAFNEVIRRSPNYPDAYLGLAYTEFWNGENDSALRNAERCIGLQPENQEALLFRAEILFAAERDSAAQAEVDRLLRKNPGFADARSLHEKIAGAQKR